MLDQRGTYVHTHVYIDVEHRRTQAVNPGWASLSCALYSRLHPYNYPQKLPSFSVRKLLYLLHFALSRGRGKPGQRVTLCPGFCALFQTSLDAGELVAELAVLFSDLIEIAAQLFKLGIVFIG